MNDTQYMEVNGHVKGSYSNGNGPIRDQNRTGSRLSLSGFSLERTDARCRLGAASGPVTFITGFLTAVLIPYIHIEIVNKLLWVPDRPEVDKEKCTCSCFDAVFKGTYETAGDSYKHLYFNATSQTLKIWTVTVFFLLVWYESVRRMLVLFTNRNIRISMAILFASNIYPMYFSFWVYFNYFNDDFYEQFTHQLFFTVTEFLTVAMVIRSCDSSVALVPRTLVAIISISMLHLVLGGVDNFIENVLQGGGEWHQIYRDWGLVIPDVLHVVLASRELWWLSRSNPYGAPVTRKDLAGGVFLVVAGVAFGRLL